MLKTKRKRGKSRNRRLLNRGEANMRLLNSLSSDGFEVSYVPHPNAKNIWSIISAGTKIRNTLRGLSACKKQESSTSKGICEFEFADFESDAHIGSTLINLGLV